MLRLAQQLESWPEFQNHPLPQVDRFDIQLVLFALQASAPPSRQMLLWRLKNSTDSLRRKVKKVVQYFP